MSMNVTLILASKCRETGKMIFTVELRYWRSIHAELMTHRVFSRNAGSSRAIPVQKVLAQVWNDPAGPTHWGTNQPGMQAKAELTGWRLKAAKGLWNLAGKVACCFAWGFMKVGLHKQVANRILEPWQWMNVLVTSTEWDNFFDLRDHPDAQPEFGQLAKEVRRVTQEAVDSRYYYVLGRGQWHIPYVTAVEQFKLPLSSLVKLSAARSARISYAPFDGNASHEKEFERHDLLVGSTPIHASPTEHQAVCLGTDERSGNFIGFRQYRWFIERGVKISD